MSKMKLFFTYLFLFLIPYVFAILLIGTAYNALVIHWSSYWRLLVGAAVGAIFMMMLKVIIQQPLGLLVLQKQPSVLRYLGRFFLVSHNRPLQIFNLGLDAVLSICGIYFTRLFFTFKFISDTAIGWLIIAMFVSVMLGSYLAFDLLKMGEPETKY
ncbi:hypothetical protein [Lapidilactobacillus bayanensis]|uniref:hypothetical protein n=1 Tax=Lapidilactobacillus bayanensis TaxID=2485998 RepID=UPI000F765EDC|nr:hypothetical protein [Lapidilactobacillus bayanensis]